MKFLPKILLSIFTLAVFTETVYAQAIPVNPNNVYEQITDVKAYVHYDMDYDGMPNWWELFYDLDPTNPLDAATDPDHDGLVNLEEYNYGTNPRNRDTDGGGVSDYWEIDVMKDPLDPRDDFMEIRNAPPPDPPPDLKGDSDGDGIPNITERLFGTNVNNIDTDGDGLNDYDEIYKYKTNPVNPDTDYDTLNDGQEINVYGTNPIAKDTDFDGLFDAAEIYTYKTNPSIWDTDNGGMSDYDEIQNNSDPLFKEDDYQFIWQIYYGEQANGLFKSLERNKIDIFQGLNLTLEARKPVEAKKLTIQFNDKGFTTEKELVKLKVLSPDEPGIYLLELMVELDNGKEIRMTRYVEIMRRGEIIRKAHGTFNNIYSRIDFFNPTKVPNASVHVYKYNEITERLETFTSEIFDIPNPQYTDENGAYVLALHPGNYLIRVYKKEFGTKDILFNTEKYTLFSQNSYLTYNYDLAIWGMIFISIFTITWFFLRLITYIRAFINEGIENRVGKSKIA